MNKFRFAKSVDVRIIVFFIVVLFVILREPNLLLQPRFWAEEASTFFRIAYFDGFFNGLIYLHHHQGYILLGLNLGGALATLVPLEFAPFVTTYYSLGFLLMIISIILFGKSYLLRERYQKYLACFALLFVPTNTEEVWLNSTNISSWVGICTLLILFENLEGASNARKYFLRGLLVFNGLSGLFSSVLIVLFFIMAVWKRHREYFVHFVIILVCLAVQLVMVLYSISFNLVSNTKISNFIPINAFTYILKFQVLDPLLGPNLAGQLFNLLGLDLVPIIKSSQELTLNNYVVAAGLVSLAVLAIIFRGLVVVRKDNSNNYMLILAFLFLGGFTSYGAMYGVPGGRYALIPGFIMMLLLINNLQVENLLWLKRLKNLWGNREKFYLFRIKKFSKMQKDAVLDNAYKLQVVFMLKNFPKIQKDAVLDNVYKLQVVFMIVVLIISLVTGYKQYWRLSYNSYENAPDWKQEVARWRDDPNYLMTIFPHPRWKFHFTKSGYALKIPGKVEIYSPATIYEAESCGTCNSFSTVLSADLEGVSGKYIKTMQSISYTFEVREAGLYQFSARVLPKDGKSDSFYVQLDKGKKETWHIPNSGSWVWRKAPFVWELSKGPHQITLHSREPTPLDQIKLEPASK